MSHIVAVRAREILDSRGRPTVEADVDLASGVSASASVPSGASTGRHEARERRDGGVRYGGRGVLGAVAAVCGEIASAVTGLDATDQAAIDARLLELDGTPDKRRLGANAVLAVSLAVARAGAAARGRPLWRHIADRSHGPRLPVPMVNLISGGLHARQGLEFQDFLAIPLRAESFAGALETLVAVRDQLEVELMARGLSTLKADEGGFGPALDSPDAALELIASAVTGADLAYGEDVAIGLDVAATHLPAAAGPELIERLAALCERHPIVSIEDPLGEDDWEGWRGATARLGGRAQIIGDDLFATSAARVQRGIAEGAADAVLVKMNQVGTLTETLAVVDLARRAGWRAVVSARSGETEDAALADLAVGSGAGQIKVGSLAQSERLAKYNRLLRIEEELGAEAYAGWPSAPPA
jgi:enolase